MPKRPDAELVKTSKFHELEFHIMRGRNESAIYYKTQIDLTNTMKFREEYNQNKEKKDQITLFEIYLAALARTAALKHKVNRFITGRRLWQRNQIVFSFVVKKEKTEEGEEVNAMIEFDPFDTIENVQNRVHSSLYKARHGVNKNEQDIKLYGALPRWIIRLMFWFLRWTDEHNMPIYSLTKDIPMWASAFIAQLGSLDIDAVYHHLFEMGTISFFITFGIIHKGQVYNPETGQFEIRDVMDMKITLDDRVSEGAYTGPVVDMIKNLIENPEPLLNPPELTDEQLDKLCLRKYKKERLMREKARKKKMKEERKKK
jgi:hypothetical protein